MKMSVGVDRGGVARFCARAAQRESILARDSCKIFVLVCCGRLGEKLLEVFKKVWRSLKQTSDLGIDVLDWLRLSLICLQNLKELLIDVWLLGETILFQVR